MKITEREILPKFQEILLSKSSRIDFRQCLIINCVYTLVNYRTLLLYDITDPYLSLPNQTVANFVAHGGVNFSWLVLLLIDRSLMTVLFPIPQS